VFQFSLLGLFLIITVTALVLATYFGVGRLAGMSTEEVLTQGLGRLLYSMPSLLVWAVGLTIAIRRLKRNRVPARLTVVALCGLMLTTFALHVVNMVLIHWVNSSRISHVVMSWSIFATGIFNAVCSAACWILVIAAIFVQRQPDKPDIGEGVSTGDPFRTNA
jgi:membrane protein CcdC involved in cytochrome C biogenesis